MSAISRPNVPRPTDLLQRILERPELAVAVRELPGPVLGKLIDRIGLEDAGELVALASTAQLERIFDDDLWQAERAGGDETFRPARFALWLRVMLEADEGTVAQRLAELPQDLLVLAVHRLVLALDIDVLAEQLADAGEEAEPIERALEDSMFEEWEEFRIIARVPEVWEEVWNALLLLDRDHHERLRAILEQCCAMDTEYISGQGGLYAVLTSDEMLESDVAATRDDRRAADGFMSPADARAFLELARRSDAGDERDPITRAYFRALETRKIDAPGTNGDGWALERVAPPVAGADARELAALLQEADLIAPAPARLQLAEIGSESGEAFLAAPLFEQAMRDLRARDRERFATRLREIGYLVNVWIVGAAHEGRRPRPMEALEIVLQTCEAGMRAQATSSAVATLGPAQALAVLARTPADVLFRQGLRVAGAPIARR